MKISLSFLAVAFAVLVSQQAVNAQMPGAAMPVGYMVQPQQQMMNPQMAGGQEEGSCGCDPGLECGRCCDPWEISAGYLYLRPRNMEITYGVPTTDLVIASNVVPTQADAYGVLDGRYDAGYTLGVSRAWGEWSSIGVRYSHYDESAFTQLHVLDPERIFPMVIHPSIVDTNPVFFDATAQQSMSFRIVDAEFRNIFAAGCGYDLAFVAGFRYVDLKQAATFGFFTADPAGVGDETVFSNINFDGAGIRLGLEGERRGNCGLLVYGKAAASFVAGDFRAEFLEATSDGADAAATTVVDTAWHAGRIVSILDLELGTGWTSPGGRLRATAGYMVSGWFNTVKTANWIHAVQTNNFTDLNNSITFDGFVGRVELRF